MADKLAALRGAREPGAGTHFTDFIANKNPKCPHCGEEIDISEHELWELYDDQDQDIECPHCDREFHVQVHVSYSYSTDDQHALEMEDEGEEGVGINGLTEAETSATSSVMGIVGTTGEKGDGNG